MSTPPEDGFEHVDLTDAFTQEVEKGRSDSAGLSDRVGKEITKPIADPLGLTDPVSKTNTKGVEDNIDLAEVIRKFITKGIKEGVGLSDTANVVEAVPVIGYSRPFQYDVGWRDVINIVTKTVEQRYKGAFEEVWSTDESYYLGPSESIVLKVSSDSDPFIEAQIPVKGAWVDANVLPANYDYILESGTVNITLSRTSGQSLDMTIKNPSGVNPATFTGMRLIARPVSVVRSVKLDNRDIDSIDVNGPKSYTDGLPWANYNDTFAISEIILNQRFKRLPMLHFEVNNHNAASMRRALEVKLSERIHVTNYNTATDDDFFVEQVSHSIEDAGFTHRTVIGCEQLQYPQLNPFTFNTVGKGFNEGVFGDRSAGPDYTGNLFILDESTLGSSTKILGL